MFEDLKKLLNENFPVVASLMSVIFGLSSLLIVFEDFIPLIYIIIASILGSILITILLVYILYKIMLKKSNPDYKTISSVDTLEILDITGKICNYSKRISIELKKDLNSFYIFLPRSSGKIKDVKCFISNNMDFSGQKEIKLTIHNYLDRKAAFIYIPFNKKEKKYIEFNWVFVDAFMETEDSFAIYPEPNQKSCKLKLISPNIESANWLVYHAENLKPYHSGSLDVFGTNNKGSVEFDYSPYLTKVYYKCSLSWIRQ